MPSSIRFVFLFYVALSLSSSSSAFSLNSPVRQKQQQQQQQRSVLSIQRAATTTTSTTQLGAITPKKEGRTWNFNEGTGPWGLKKNAETWNGRVAQVAFVIVFLQELITGKGVIAGVQEGDGFSLVMAAFAAVSTIGLTIWLAIQGSDEYVDE